MTALAIVGMTLGMFGFIFGIGAWHKIGKLEAELKRRQIIDKEFESDR
jgi:hypothetical protein